MAGSFTSAGLSAVLAIVSLSSNTFWPVVIICSLSVTVLLTIAVFFLALKCSLLYRKRQAHASYVRELRAIAAAQVLRLDTAQLMRESADDPELARAFLMQILAEYEQVAEGPRRETDEGDRSSSTVRQLMNCAGSTHPVIQTLNLIASDFRERSA
ncbi:hypothetical protein OG735_18085 [Streptomyces sp. NBC_01210]|uniref:hypothetical protein n=1 Tax=Streptomyces sp. NBC_01210 TaxID=2903774 RepID=UPI002E13D414|nr:hypothetical protein OG735_18085 [Streptomyces sp. NBC_01210]